MEATFKDPNLSLRLLVQKMEMLLWMVSFLISSASYQPQCQTNTLHPITMGTGYRAEIGPSGA